MQSNNLNEVVILGVTRSGQVFRPSDWAERLAGVISSIRPAPANPGDHFSYSPWCVPNSFNGQKCVVVHTNIREANVMAWDFLMGFAKDNYLQILDSRE